MGILAWAAALIGCVSGPEGLAHQRRSSRYGVIGALLWILALFLAIVSVA